MEYIYIIQQTWNSPFSNMDNCIMSAHKVKQEAEKILKEYYEEDKKWLIEEYGAVSEENFEYNEVDERHSFIQYEDCWSSNEIIKIALQ